jgi:hypothetical protein
MRTLIRRLIATRRFSSLLYLTRPLALTFAGVVLLSLGVAYLVIHAYQTVEFPTFFWFLTLQFLPYPARGILLLLAGLGVLAAGIWHLSGMVVIPLHDEEPSNELVLGYRKTSGPPRIAVLSGGAGLFILSGLSEQVERLTCITPVQDQIEYYWRASSLFNSQKIYYVTPTPIPTQIYVELDDATIMNIKHVDIDPDLAERHVTRLMIAPGPEGGDSNGVAHNSGGLPRSSAVFNETISLSLTRLAREALREADAIVLGPGSLYESILPNLLIDELRETIQQSKACKIFICNLMTEPGLTTGYNVGDHIRQIKKYGGFTPDYVLVNAQRIEPAIRQLYAAAQQAPVYLEPEEYEETAVLAGDQASQQHVVIEGSVVIESDLSSSVVQYTASLDNPGESRAVRVLRHDDRKLTAAILELLKRR